MLELVATRLVDCVRVTDIVARLGGDEFAILLDGCADAVAARVVASMQPEAVIGDQPVSTSIGVGIAHHHTPVALLDDECREGAVASVRQLARLTTALEREAATVLLLREADTAMYAAKGAGKNRAAS